MKIFENNKENNKKNNKKDEEKGNKITDLHSLCDTIENDTQRTDI